MTESNKEKFLEMMRVFGERIKLLQQDRTVLQAEYNALFARSQEIAADLDRQWHSGLLRPTVVTEKQLLDHNKGLTEIFEVMLANEELITRYFEAYYEDVRALGVPLKALGREMWPDSIEE